MSKRTLGFLFVLIGIIIIGAIVYFIFLGREGSPPAANLGEGGRGTLETSSQAGKKAAATGGGSADLDFSEPETVEPEQIAESSAAKVASGFAERFGSYSNQSGFENMSDLELNMTGSMKEWSLKYVEDAKKKSGDLSKYYGVTTKAINAKAESTGEGSSTVVLVKTQRMETTGDADPKTFAQDIRITLVKSGKAWKVDRAEWLPVK
jgi:hypothetical protein